MSICRIFIYIQNYITYIYEIYIYAHKHKNTRNLQNYDFTSDNFFHIDLSEITRSSKINILNLLINIGKLVSRKTVPIYYPTSSFPES